MRLIYSIQTIIIIILAFLIGCSAGESNPVTPSNEESNNHKLLGVWTVNFDFEKLEADIEQNKNLVNEKNIAMWLPTPSAKINSFSNINSIVDLDLEVENPFPADAYDPRLLVYADDQGRLLLNADQWTRLYAYRGGWLVNPFRALATDDPERIFKSKSKQTTNLRILLPKGATTVHIAIDASYPGHCKEPYKFENLRHTVINPQFKSSSFVEVEVYDWQDDVSALYLRCPEITDYPFSTFNRVIGDTWGMYLINRRNAPAGEYKAMLIGFSEKAKNTVLCDLVTIEIVPDTIPPKWVSTVGITDVSAGNGEVTVFWNMAVDPPNAPPIYYLLYVDTDDQPWDQVPVVRFWHNPYTFTGLTNGVTYYFNIRAMDSADPPNVDQNTIIRTATPHS